MWSFNGAAWGTAREFLEHHRECQWVVALQETRLSLDGMAMVVGSQAKQGWQIAGAPAVCTAAVPAEADLRHWSAEVAHAVPVQVGIAFPSGSSSFDTHLAGHGGHMATAWVNLSGGVLAAVSAEMAPAVKVSRSCRPVRARHMSLCG